VIRRAPKPDVTGARRREPVTDTVTARPPEHGRTDQDAEVRR